VMKTEVSAAASIQRNDRAFPSFNSPTRITIPFDLNRGNTVQVNLTSSTGLPFFVRLRSGTGWNSAQVFSGNNGNLNRVIDIPTTQPLHANYWIEVNHSIPNTTLTISGWWRYTCNTMVERTIRYRVDDSTFQPNVSLQQRQLFIHQQASQAVLAMNTRFGILFTSATFDPIGTTTLDGRVCPSIPL
jgi:hypothetical protein